MMNPHSFSWVPLNVRKPLSFDCSRNVLYLESTIAVLNIDHSSRRRYSPLCIHETLTGSDKAPGATRL